MSAPADDSTVRVDFATSGEHFEFRSDPADPNRLLFDFVVDPGGGVPLRHRHPDQTETYRCSAGRLHLTLGDDEVVLDPGGTVTVHPGVVHSLVNRGDDTVRCEVEYRPAGRNRAWFQLHGAHIEATGREPALLDLAPFIGAVGVYVERPPVVVQRLLFGLVLKPLAVLLGRRRRMLALARARYGDDFVW